MVANLDHARRFIAVLHGMGCEFALDDFGSGLSRSRRSKTLPMDYLKIDGSFIRNLAVDSVNQAMVAAMIELSRSLQFPHRGRAGRGSAVARCREEHGHRLRAGIHHRAPPAALGHARPPVRTATGAQPGRADSYNRPAGLITNCAGISTRA